MRRDHACFHNQPSPGEEPGRSSEIFLQCVNLWKTTERMRRLVLSPALGKLAAEAAQCDGIHLYHDHVLTKRPGAEATNWHLDNGSDPFTSPQQVMKINLWVYVVLCLMGAYGLLRLMNCLIIKNIKYN